MYIFEVLLFSKLISLLSADFLNDFKHLTKLSGNEFSFKALHKFLLKYLTLKAFYLIYIFKHWQLFNPTRRGLWNGHQEGGGGLLMPAPIKTHLKALLARFFCIGRVGDKNNLGKHFQNGF